MAKDDMRLVMYKVLKYLYRTNREGKVPSFEDMFNACGLAGMPDSYITQILRELVDEQLVKGVSFVETKDGMIIQMGGAAIITSKGVLFLEENSHMKKAAEVAGLAFEKALTAIIKAAMPL